MFAKLVVVILCLGAVAATLLALRQQRIQAMHELAESRLRLRAADERLWLLRAEIARRLAPEELEARIASAGGMVPAGQAPALRPALDGVTPTGTGGEVR